MNFISGTMHLVNVTSLSYFGLRQIKVKRFLLAVTAITRLISLIRDKNVSVASLTSLCVCDQDSGIDMRSDQRSMRRVFEELKVCTQDRHRRQRGRGRGEDKGCCTFDWESKETKEALKAIYK